MNVEIGTEAAQFPEKEYMNGIFFAVSVHGEVGIDKLYRHFFKIRSKNTTIHIFYF